MTKIIINGVNGRMGQAVAEFALRSKRFQVVAGVDLNKDSLDWPFPVYAKLEEVADPADAIIDFTRPGSITEVLPYAKAKNMGAVIATTGFTPEQLEYIRSFTTDIPVFRSANMSLGINLLQNLAQQAVQFLGDTFDIEIVERHHNQKLDSPSGTALTLADSINDVLSHKKEYVYGRHSQTEKRQKNELGIHAVRGGSIVGDHEISFISDTEIVALSHNALSRRVFAEGALRAALYIQGRPPKLYDMQDMISGERTVTHLYTDQHQAIVTLNKLPHDPKILADIFGALAKQNISIDMISQTAPVAGTISLSFSMSDQDLAQAFEVLRPFNAQNPGMRLDIMGSAVKLTVEGMGMERQSGVAANMFALLAQHNIQTKLVTTAETKISVIIDETDEYEATDLIAKAYSLV